MKKVLFDNYASGVIADTEEVVDNINDLDLTDSRVIGGVKRKVFSQLKQILESGLEPENNLETVIAISAALTRVIAAERGCKPIKTGFKVAEDSLEAKTFAFFANFKRGQEIKFIISQENGLYQDAQRLSLSGADFYDRARSISGLFTIIGHEVEHLAQAEAESNLKKRPNEAAALSKLENEARKDVRVADYYDAGGGHNEFVFEIDADAAGIIASRVYMQQLLDFCGMSKYSDDYKKAVSASDPTGRKMKKIMELTAKRFGFKDEKDGLKPTRPSTLKEAIERDTYLQLYKSAHGEDDKNFSVWRAQETGDRVNPILDTNRSDLGIIAAFKKPEEKLSGIRKRAKMAERVEKNQKSALDEARLKMAEIADETKQK